MEQTDRQTETDRQRRIQKGMRGHPTNSLCNVTQIFKTALVLRQLYSDAGAKLPLRKHHFYNTVAKNQ